MKNAWLLHGTGGSGSDYFWFSDTKDFLESEGYQVWWPALPNTNDPNINETLDFIRNNSPELTEETIIIGHSSACPVILEFIKYSDTKAKQVILVGGYYEKLGDSEKSKQMLPDKFDWGRIKIQSKEFILINSDDDPWQCHDKQAREPAIKLGAKLIVNTGQGHMGSINFGQPYRQFDLLKKLIDV